MPFTKHVGRIVSTQQKVVVMFRQLPDDPSSCLLVDVQGLSNDMHNDLMNEVESAQAQSKVDFSDHAHTHFFRDGRKMLDTLHREKKFIKLETDKVMMTPDNNTNIRLDELNEQLGALKTNPKLTEDQFNTMHHLSSDAVTVGDEVKPDTVVGKKDTTVLDDFSLAKGYVVQAEGMETEAKNLREQAYDLIPRRKFNDMRKKEDAVG
jgi:hypothetical protein|tara:strand:+ start:714 stop:1334 length:621 start_codon:yes stop_codon:yes gene_type:complete